MSEIGSGRVTFENEVELSEAVEYLEGLVRGLRERRVRIEHGTSNVTVRPGRVLTLKVKARAKKDRESIFLELRWRTTVPVENREGFRVRQTDPEPETAT